MNDRFLSFLVLSRWVSAIVALMYHLRFLLFVDYSAVSAKTNASKAFYFLTGLGHESFAVFVVLDGVVTGMIMRRHRPAAPFDRTVVVPYFGALYRIVLPCLILGAAFDFAGARYFNQHGVYTDFPQLSTLTISLSSLLGNFLMMQPFIVPNFGSNSMLYLLSYLFWFLILLLLFTQTGTLSRTRRVYAQLALLLIVVLVMPYKFLIWGAIWFSGVLVAVFGEVRVLKPGPVFSSIIFACTLVLSRLLTSNTVMFSEQLSDWIIEAKFLVVGISFAFLARALYPESQQGPHERLVGSVIKLRTGQAGLAASFTFYFHFPVIMLLVAMSTSVLELPLMQQPTWTRYVEFGCIVGISLCSAAVIARAMAVEKTRKAVDR
jgi:hypothetical protein